MCFSAPVSFAAGGVLGITGIATLKKTKSRKEILFASFPLLFGIQQLIEGSLWIYFGSAFLKKTLTLLFLTFSHLLWPVVSPLSVYLLERDTARKKILFGLTILGVMISVYFLVFMLNGPVDCSIIDLHIVYTVPMPLRTLARILYGAVVASSFLVSSSRMINIYGILLIISIAVSLLFFHLAFISVWCFFAALLSFFVYCIFKKRALG